MKIILGQLHILSGQVKVFGNPLMCTYLQGWSERELGCCMNRKQLRYRPDQFWKDTVNQMKCCCSTCNLTKLLLWHFLLLFSGHTSTRYWGDKTCGKLQFVGSYAQSLEWSHCLQWSLRSDIAVKFWPKSWFFCVCYILCEKYVVKNIKKCHFT